MEVGLYKLRRLWLVLGWAGVLIVIYLSLVPSPPEPFHAKYSDKVEHALAYGLLMLWFCQDYQRYAQRALVAALLTALGISMEFLQGLTGYRSCELGDMLANTTGVLIGWGSSHTILGQVGIKLERRFLRSNHDEL